MKSLEYKELFNVSWTDETSAENLTKEEQETFKNLFAYLIDQTKAYEVTYNRQSYKIGNKTIFSIRCSDDVNDVIKLYDINWTVFQEYVLDLTGYTTDTDLYDQLLIGGFLKSKKFSQDFIFLNKLKSNNIEFEYDYL